MFIALTKKQIISIVIGIVFCVVSSLSITYVYSKPAGNIPNNNNNCIVLDAGHGGIDGGAVGVNTGVTESEINLKITKILKKYLVNFGMKVVLTRCDMNGLYDTIGNNFKKQDMEKRKEIIEKANAKLVVSIHQNSFPNSSQFGAQAFYLLESDESFKLANSIQNQMKINLKNARDFANFGDYYMLKVLNCPISIVECGYLSNPDDEALLINEQYQNKVAYSIFCGIVEYLGIKN